MARTVRLEWARVSRLARAASSGRPAWWDVAGLRALFEGEREVRVVAHLAGPDAKTPQFAFLAAEVAGVMRSVVLVQPAGALLAFDLATAGADAVWQLTGRPPARPIALLDGPSEFLHLIPLGAADAGAPAPQLIDEMDLAGVLLPAPPRERLGSWAVLFHRDRYANGSAVHFLAGGRGALECVVTGLAPGDWEVWRDGWSVARVMCEPGQGAVHFSSRPGMHFLRMLA